MSGTVYSIVHFEYFNLVTGRPNRLLMLVNPRSGNAKAEMIYKSTVAPLMQLMDIDVDKVGKENVHSIFFSHSF